MDVPQISTRDTQTTVALRENQTLVIGGLIQDNTQRTESKVPLLGDLPLVGRLFRDETLNGVSNELIITVTPHVVTPGAPDGLYPGAAKRSDAAAFADSATGIGSADGSAIYAASADSDDATAADRAAGVPATLATTTGADACPDTDAFADALSVCAGQRVYVRVAAAQQFRCARRRGADFLCVALADNRVVRNACHAQCHHDEQCQRTHTEL